jgi:hypothetical protein
MPNFNIDAYRASFQGGAKQYLFYYKPNFPIATNIDKLTYLVRTTSLPETTTEEIITNWQGFDFKFAGKYTFSDFTVTFNVDAESDIIKSLYDWARLIHDPTSNKSTKPSTYMADQVLELLDHEGNPTIKYKLIGAWPKSIGTIDLDYSASEVAQVQVTFSYIYHVIDKTTYEVGVTF